MRAPTVRPMDAPLPTFFVVGAPKAGTTSLHAYLALHPDIAMTSVKEPMCFVGPDWRERLARYAELFPRPAAVRGEASTAYSAFPWEPDVADRVRSTVPDARIIYLVRDPVERTLAHYAQNVWDSLPVRPFPELMTDLEDPMNMPVWCSRYATQLERWVSRFGTEQVLVVDAQALRTDRAATVRQVVAFVGADPGFTADWSAEHNTAAAHRVETALARRLAAAGGPAARVAARPALRPVLTRPVRRPRLTPAQRRRLCAVLAPEADRLRAMTGLALAHWSV